MPQASDLLLEYRQEGRKTWSMRFYQDGRVEEYSDEMVEFKDGQFITHAIPLEWRDVTVLVPVEMAKVNKALREADFFNLPAQFGDASQVKDGTVFTWTANLEGKSKTVRAVGGEAANHPALKQLSEMIQDVTADAFEREAGEDS